MEILIVDIDIYAIFLHQAITRPRNLTDVASNQSCNEYEILLVLQLLMLNQVTNELDLKIEDVNHVI